MYRGQYYSGNINMYFCDAIYMDLFLMHILILSERVQARMRVNIQPNI